MDVRAKQCADCGDDIPYYTRICPFCHYELHAANYDVNSSPYLMMRDLKLLCMEFSELRKINSHEALIRVLTMRKIDPWQEQVSEIEVTFDVVHELLLIQFGQIDTVRDSLVVFEEMMADMLAVRAEQLKRVRATKRLIVRILVALFVILLGVISLLLYFTSI